MSLSQTVARTPRHPRAVAVSVLLAWVEAAALTCAFIALGAAIDGRLGLPTAAMIIVASATLAATATALATFFAAHTEHVIERRLRMNLIAAVWDRGVHAATGSTDAILSLASDAVPRAARYRGAFIGPTIGAFSTPLAVLALVAIFIDPLTAGVLAGMVVLVPAIIVLAQRAARPSGAAHRREQGRLTVRFRQNLQGLGTLVTHRAAASAAQELTVQGEQHRRALMRVLATNQLIILVMDATVNLGLLLVGALLALHRVTEGTITPGSALALVGATLLVIRPIALVGQFFYIGIGGRAAERALHTAVADPPTGARTGSRTGSRAGPPLEPHSRRFTAADTRDGCRGNGADHRLRTAAFALDRVTAGWDGGDGAHTEPIPVLRNLSLSVRPGEHVALIGPSGAGKSTVAALLQVHLMPTTGRVFVGGAASNETTPATIRRRIATVEQRTFLFHGSIADNLALAHPTATVQDMWAALSLAGLEAEVRAMPGGLSTPVGEHGRALSGGQSQRIAIARAALRDAPILIFDEPTSQVDLAGEAAFLARLRALARGRTVLMIAHRPESILAADRTIVLEPQPPASAGQAQP